MIGHFKTLAGAILTMLIGASYAESAEMLVDPSEDSIEIATPDDDDGESPNVMSDVL